ncbi:MAG: trypco2 family protein [Geminicoccaceae bacterium]
MPNAASIPLAEAIKDLRAELLEAMREGADKGLRFRLKPVELELNLSMSREGGAGGKVKFWVVELGADGKLQQATTHRLKLILEPRGPGGKEVDVSDADAERPV